MGAITLLAFQGTDVPQALETLTFGALTATTALLARTQPAVSGAVEVTNTPANPIPVEPASDTPPPAAAGAEPGV
jgi:hypothetical protein